MIRNLPICEIHGCILAGYVQRLGELQGIGGNVESSRVDVDCRQMGTTAIRQSGVLFQVGNISTYIIYI